jgi:hypothetical protein
MFQRNMSSASSQIKKKASKSSTCCLLHAGFLLELFYDAEDGSDIFL